MLLTPVQLTALGWVILFFCSLYQISEEATSSTGGKVILYTLQKGDTGDEEGHLTFGQATFM